MVSKINTNIIIIKQQSINQHVGSNILKCPTRLCTTLGEAIVVVVMFTSTVNMLGHVGTVGYSNHLIPGKA